jgi:hypothetical protein
MKYKILIGCILSIGVLLMIPSVSAIQSDTLLNNYKEKIPSFDLNKNINELMIKNQNNPYEPNFIILFLLSIIINLLRFVKFVSIFAVILLIIIIRMASNNSSAVY